MTLTDARFTAAFIAVAMVAAACASDGSPTQDGDAGSTAVSSVTSSAGTATSTSPTTAAVEGVAAGTTGAASTSERPAGPRPLILDYSPTLSDLPALLFLAANPDVELLAVTLAGTGESDCEPGVRHTRSLLAVAGRPEVPVACGTEKPMNGSRDWPREWRDSSNTVVGVLLPGVPPQEAADAADLLVATLEAAEVPVTIVTLAPLTNIGNLLRAHPELLERIESVVVMGGAFDIDGNVDVAPTAEWNLHIDPESVRAVVDSGVAVTFVGLDATDHVPGNRRLAVLLAHASSTPAGEAVRQLWAPKLDTITSPGWFFWDELAAVAATDDGVVSIERRRIRIDDDGATVLDASGVEVEVAVAADRDRFEAEFLRVFAGGVPVEIEELSAEDAEYIAALDGALSRFDTALDAVFVDVFGDDEMSTSGDQVDGFATGFGLATSAHVADLAAIDAPSSFAEMHDRLLATSSSIVELIPAFRDAMAVRAAELTDPEMFFDLIESAATDTGLLGIIDDYGAECTTIAEVALLRGSSLGECFGTDG